MELLRVAVESALRVHPRVAQQHIADTPPARARLASALPPLRPFRAAPAHSLVAVLDWDHRLPSQKLLLRMHLCYDAASAARFESAYDERAQLVAARDRFPEFDVPDFEELPADECYEAELTAALAVESMRLTSGWRREVDGRLAERAVRLVRASPEFARIRAAESSRPSNLGDLDPVSWMPPCESSHAAWTIDVWWLTAFDGRTGTGWSFLVDLEQGGGALVTHREFTVRAG